jgi:hypothetical protein
MKFPTSANGAPMRISSKPSPLTSPAPLTDQLRILVKPIAHSGDADQVDRSER